MDGRTRNPLLEKAASNNYVLRRFCEAVDLILAGTLEQRPLREAKFFLYKIIIRIIATRCVHGVVCGLRV